MIPSSGHSHKFPLQYLEPDSRSHAEMNAKDQGNETLSLKDGKEDGKEEEGESFSKISAAAAEPKEVAIGREVVTAGLAPIHSFVRIKPLDADKGGGTAAGKQLKTWDEAKGTVEMDVDGRSKVFDHMDATIGPDATQEQVYDVICSPLVRRFVEGFDVDLICYGQTGSGKTFTAFGPPLSGQLRRSRL